MDAQELKKLKLHLQGALDCLAKYEMAETDTTKASDDETDDEPDPSDSSDDGSDSGLKSMKMKMLGYKNRS